MTKKTTNPGSQAGMIRTLLARHVTEAKIVTVVKKAFPKQKPTIGYVRWLAEKSKAKK